MNTTKTAPAIGTCAWAAHTIRVEAKPAQQFTACPICEPVNMGGMVQRSMVRWAKVGVKVTTTECDSACTSAKGSKCSCECGGHNHGMAWAR